MARRAIRSLPREPEAIIPAIIVPVFFFFVNVGSLQKLAQSSGSVTDFKAFQLPVAIIFAVTGVSRASALVTDIQDGYFDRLLVTPVKRPALLLGMMQALGAVYREVIGRHYPAMTAVAVTALVEGAARVEIEATAVIPD